MLRQMIICLGAGMALAGCATAVATDDISYVGNKRSPDGIIGQVTAESRYGTATVSGPVRRISRDRLEVRLPGGTWVECARSCSDTLRRETVDFWQNHGGGGRGGPSSNEDGPGYLILKRN